MKLVCPDCGRQYESGKFCPECGGKLQEVTPELVCPSCGYKAKSGKFCPECGTKLTEQLSTEEETVNTKSAERTFNEKDPRFAKYYDRKGFPRTIPQEERDVAIEELTQYANQNIAEAKMLLGNILLGDSTNKVAYLKGAKLIKEAEAAGDKFAYYLMGIVYLMDVDTVAEQDLDESEKRLLEAYQEYQDGGTAGMLAYLYTFATEKCDYKKAFEYATIAVDDDDSEGFFVLGALYFNGWGVEKDVNRALDNYKMAAALGDAGAMNQIGFIFMGDEGIEANPEQSFYWFNEAAKKGDDVGMYNLGCCYKNGFGIEADVEQAAEWFKKSAKLGYVGAMVELGEYYQATLVDFEKSKMWYLKAAELGNADAQNKLGVLCANIDNDYKEAVKWYKKAMEQDDYWAYENYAECLWNGNGVQENKKKAMEMMQKAISLGHPNAEDELKEMQQALAKSKKEDAKDPQPKKNQVKKKTDVVRIENVNFSTDGRKNLLIEFEVEYNHKFDICEFEFCVYANNKICPSAIGCSGSEGEQLSINREKFSFRIQDYELSLKTGTTNKLSLTIEAYQLDERWDGTQDPKMFPVVASHKTNLKLYFESHIFGKNVLEIK